MKVCCSHLGYFVDTTEGWVPVIHFESLSLKSFLLHAIVVKGADSVKIFSLGQSLQLLGRLVQIKHLLHAVEVVTNIITVLEYSKRSVDLIFESVVHFLSSKIILLIIINSSINKKYR